MPDEPAWPKLPFPEWRATCDALHMWTQVVGKTLLARSVPQNHWWHSAFRVSSRGLVNPSRIRNGDQTLDVELDLMDHVLRVGSETRIMAMPLVPRSVHAFYDEFLAILRAFGLDLHLWTMPVEVPDPVPFDQDDAPRPYDADAVHRFWHVLRSSEAVLSDFAASFVGKQSPVHFFWGSFDLASTRFSGRRAPEKPGTDRVTREAYSHEVISFGFWPGGVSAGGVEVDEPIFYAYAAPEPAGFRDAALRSPAARYDAQLGEFVLPYEAVRTARAPAIELRRFCEDVYEAGAELGGWDRQALERSATGFAASAPEAPPAIH